MAGGSTPLSETSVAGESTLAKRKLVQQATPATAAHNDDSPSKQVCLGMCPRRDDDDDDNDDDNNDEINRVAYWMTRHLLGVRQKQVEYGMFLARQLVHHCDEPVLVRSGACVYVISTPNRGNCPCGCSVPAQEVHSCGVANMGADRAKQCSNCDSLLGPAMCFMANVLRSRPLELTGQMTGAQAAATAEFCKAARQVSSADAFRLGDVDQTAHAGFADVAAGVGIMTAAVAGALAKHTPFHAFWKVFFGFTLPAVATSNEHLAGWLVVSAAGALLGRVFSPGEHVTIAALAPALVRAATAPTFEERWSSAVHRPLGYMPPCGIRRVRRNVRDEQIFARTAWNLQHDAGWKRQLVDFVLHTSSVTHKRRQQLEAGIRALTSRESLLVTLAVVPQVPLSDSDSGLDVSARAGTGVGTGVETR